jgi:hypothetical protein
MVVALYVLMHNMGALTDMAKQKMALAHVFIDLVALS